MGLGVVGGRVGFWGRFGVLFFVSGLFLLVGVFFFVFHRSVIAPVMPVCVRQNFSDLYFYGFNVSVRLQNGSVIDESIVIGDDRGDPVVLNHSGMSARSWLVENLDLAVKNMTLMGYGMMYVPNGCLEFGGRDGLVY